MKLKTILGITFIFFVFGSILTIGYDRTNPEYVEADIELQQSAGITLDEHFDNEVTRINNPPRDTLQNLKIEFGREVIKVQMHSSDPLCVQAKLDALKSVDCSRIAEEILQ